MEIAAVTVDGRTFGQRLPDAKPDVDLYTVSQFQQALDTGLIKPTGKSRERRKW